MVLTSEGLGRQEGGRGKDTERRGRRPVFPGNSVFMKNSFLMRRVQPPQNFVSYLDSELRCLISLPLSNP